MKNLLLIVLTMLIIASTAIAAPIGKWKNMPIKVYIEDNRNAYLMKRAFGDWEQSSSKLVRFEYVTSKDNANIIVEWVDVYGDSSAVGKTYPFVDNKGYFVGALIEIAKYTNSQTIKLQNTELTKIMRHEIGHAIGLPHSNNPNGIMNPSTDRVLMITKDDLRDLRAIYGQ